MKPKTQKPHLLCLIILLFISQSLFSQIITVKQDGTGDFTTIQEGINASIDKDTVLVFPGTYFENIFYGGKEITLASLFLTTQDKSYINSTIIDGNQNGSCVRIGSGEDESTVLCGFTLQNGTGYSNKMIGGGLYIKNSSINILSCIITDNFARIGGGILCVNSYIYLSDSKIHNNWSIRCGGGMNVVQNSSVIFDSINRCDFYLNYSSIGSDISKIYTVDMHIFADTFSVINPDHHFIISGDEEGNPVNNFLLDIKHSKIDVVNSDVYVNPLTGDNNNSGLSPENPLKTIAYAYKKILPDTNCIRNIFLADGVYSPNLSDERFPLNARSYINLIGESRDSTIFNADTISFLLRGNRLTRNYSIKNMSFINGFGNYSQIGTSSEGGVFLNTNTNVNLTNIKLDNCIGINGPGIVGEYVDSLYISDVILSNNLGALSLMLINWSEIPRIFEITNCIMTGNGPDSNPEYGNGGGLGIGGSLNNPDHYNGTVANIQITNNINKRDPGWGPGSTVALSVGNHAKVDLINATIGDNIVLGELGSAVGLGDGAELSIYNSIFYGNSLYELEIGNPIGPSYSSTVNVSYSDLEGGEEWVKIWNSNHTLNWLDGNINEDPLWDTASAFPYSLQQDSPCINVGTPMYEPGMQPPFIISEDDTLYYLVTLNYGDTILLPSTDLAGRPRISGGRIDMGAYEFDTTAGINELFPQNTVDNKIIVYPNPFYYHTFIAFKLLHGGNVQVIIYDINGKKVKSLMNAKVSKGEFTMTWEGNNDQNQIVKQGTYVAVVMINGKKASGVKILKRK
ncbi:MAG: T9SS type A sorting domain-containing protein [Bacteroidales bacterium]|nr:T9SS type A sorting domain-containing protein [Bacteroidales bacterium]